MLERKSLAAQPAARMMLCAALLASTAPAALAQTIETPVKLDPVSVTAQPEPSLTVPSTEGSPAPDRVDAGER